MYEWDNRHAHHTIGTTYKHARLLGLFEHTKKDTRDSWDEKPHSLESPPDESSLSEALGIGNKGKY
jgi:hypothetical protein